MLTLVIKGTPAQARAAAAKRNVTLGKFVQYDDEAKHVTFRADPDQRMATVGWFHEPSRPAAPYPIGTLLFYSLGE